MNNINLIIDFDSTIVKVETLDVIAQISSTNDNSIVNQIKNITNDAMNGKIGFHEALIKRIKILNATQENLNEATIIIKKSISESFIKNKKFFKENQDNCYILSGGFKEIIEPIAITLGFKKENIFANTFKIKNKIVYSIDENNFLSHDKGKVKVSKQLINTNNKKTIILGDGYTDYELKKYKAADIFIAYTENINRKSVVKNADIVANNFDKVIEEFMR